MPGTCMEDHTFTPRNTINEDIKAGRIVLDNQELKFVRPAPKKYTKRTLPLIITVDSSGGGCSSRRPYVIKVERLEDGESYKMLMSGHAPWTVRALGDKDMALHVAAISIAGTILSLANEAAETSNTWNGLRLRFRFGTSGCCIGNIVWPSLDNIHIQMINEHVAFVVGNMEHLFGV